MNITSIHSHVPHFEERSDSADTTRQHNAPAHEHHHHPAHRDGSPAGRGSGLPDNRSLAASIAMQLMQALADGLRGSHGPAGQQPNSPVERAQGPLMVNSNTNTVDTGRYTIAASQDRGGTLTVTDNTSGESFKVWGDPHIETSDGDKTDFMRQPATFELPDGTKITITPTKGEDKTYIDNMTITRGDDAAQIGGVHDGNLHTVAQRGEGRYLDGQTPDGTVLQAKDGHIDDLMLRNGTEIKDNNIKNIDQFATPEQPPNTTKPARLPPAHHEAGHHKPNHTGPFPAVMHPGWGANQPGHMGPFASNMPKDWGIAMLYVMGMYLAAMFQGMGAGTPGAKESASKPSTGPASTPTPSSSPESTSTPAPTPSQQPSTRAPTSSTGSTGTQAASQGLMMVNSNTNTVDTGRYTIHASKDDGGTLTVTDNTTGENFKIWGDPHIETGDGDKTDFMHQPATFMLPDDTKVTVTPTQGDGATYIDNVTITRGNDAAQIGGVHDGNLHTVALRDEGRYLDNATPDGTVLQTKGGHIDDLVLANGTEIKDNNVQNIDAYAGSNASATTPAATANPEPVPNTTTPDTGRARGVWGPSGG